MNTAFLSQASPEVSLDQRKSAEIAKLIRKLRWIGKEDEAESIERQLGKTPLAERGCVLAEPLSTD